MPNNFTPMGVEAVALGVDSYIRDMRRMDRAQQEASGSISKLGRVANTATDVMVGFGRAATGLIGVGNQLSQIFSRGQLAAGVQQTRRSFAQMLQVIGANENLLEDLRSASLGTVSDQVLMSSTMTLLAGAGDELAVQLANATPELLEIAKAASRANPSLGDTAFLYQSIATGVKRASPLILDNLGLTIRVGEANAAYAASIGKTVDELTSEERAIALLNATLAAGDTLIRQAGGSTESLTDDFERLNANMENFNESLSNANIFGRTWVEWTADAAGGMANLTEGINATQGALADLEDQVVSGEVSYDDYLDTISAMPDLLEVIYLRFGRLTEAEILAAQANANVGSEAHGMARDFTIASSAIGDAADNVDALAGAYDRVQTNIRGTVQAVQEQIAFIQAGGLELVGLAEEIEASWAAGDITGGQAQELLQELDLAALAVEVDMGELTIPEATRQAVDEYDLSWQEAQQAIQNARAEIGQIPESIRTQIQLEVQYTLVGTGNQPGLGGFQHGGSFEVSGLPGPDRNIVSLPVGRGEVVTVTPPPSVSSRSFTMRDFNSHDGGIDQYTFNKMMEEWLGA